MFYTAGSFDKIRDGQLQHFSGFLCLDIDRKDNPHLTDSEFKSRLYQFCQINKTVAFCGQSVRGKGYFALVRIADHTRYREYYQLYRQAIKARLNLNIDKSCSNLNRGRYVSYDPNPYINDNAEVAGMLPAFKKPEAKRRNYEPVGDDDRAKAENLINQINKRRIDITGGNTDWFAIGCSLANTFGESGRDYFQQVSQHYSNGLFAYDPGETDQKYNHCLNHAYGYTLGTFFHYCLQAGLVLPKAQISKRITGEPLPVTSTDDYPAFWDKLPDEQTTLQLIPQWPQTMQAQLYKVSYK